VYRERKSRCTFREEKQLPSPPEKEAIFFTALNKAKNPHKKSSKRNKMSEKNNFHLMFD